MVRLVVAGDCGRLPAAAPPTLLKVEPGPGTPARVKTVARVQQPDLARGRGTAPAWHHCPAPGPAQ